MDLRAFDVALSLDPQWHRSARIFIFFSSPPIVVLCFDRIFIVSDHLGSNMIMDTLTGVLSGGDTGHGTFSLSFDTFKLLGSDIGDLEQPPPSKSSAFPTVDIRLVNPKIKKEDGDEEEAEDDTLNTPVSTSADVSTFFCTDTTISDPVPITGIYWLIYWSLLSLFSLPSPPFLHYYFIHSLLSDIDF